MEFTKKIGSVATEFGYATLVATRLEDNHIEVHLEIDSILSRQVLSWNPHRCDTAANEFLMKESGAGEQFFDAILASGLFIDSGRRFTRGFLSCPVWAIRDPANVPPLRTRKVCALLMPT